MQDDGSWVIPTYDKWMQEAKSKHVKERLRRGRNRLLKSYRIPIPKSNNPKRKYNATPEGTMAKSEKMKEYWRKSKASSLKKESKHQG